MNYFLVGVVDLMNIDVIDECVVLLFIEIQMGCLCEFDGLQWIDNDYFVIVNEGDMDGGLCGFIIFYKDGIEVFESGILLEQVIIQVGYYLDKCLDSKGNELEGMEFVVYGDILYLFVLFEWLLMIGVYDVIDLIVFVLVNLLLLGIGLEGVVVILLCNLFVLVNEVDLIEDGGVCLYVMIYELQDVLVVYLQLILVGIDELIGWGVILGMVVGDNGMVYVVNDSFYGYQLIIFIIDIMVIFV